MWIYPGLNAADDTDLGINSADFLNLQLWRRRATS